MLYVKGTPSCTQLGTPVCNYKTCRTEPASRITSSCKRLRGTQRDSASDRRTYTSQQTSPESVRLSGRNTASSTLVHSAVAVPYLFIVSRVHTHTLLFPPPATLLLRHSFTRIRNAYAKRNRNPPNDCDTLVYRPTRLTPYSSTSCTPPVAAVAVCCRRSKTGE